ncbi:hypothetical protein ADUPG1_005483, partial [Aduncisulcus paluster]
MDKVLIAEGFDEAKALLERYEDIWKVELPDEGSGLNPLKIVLKDDSIGIVSKPRRLSPALKGAVEKTIELGLKEKLIVKSDSEYDSPVVVVKKRMGDYRMCVDYTAINKVMKNIP